MKEEIPWYVTRAYGGWGAVAVVLMVLHFALPFLLLLQRQRKAKAGAAVAGGGNADRSQSRGCLLAHCAGFRPEEPARRAISRRWRSAECGSGLISGS